jgi:predicted PurR-regulated permease PerM
MRLHPIVIVVSVGAGLLVAGLSGAFLAVPLVAVLTSAAGYYRSARRGATPEPASPPPLAGPAT